MSVLCPWSINRTPHISSLQSCTVCFHSVYQWFPVDLSMPQKIIGHAMRSPKRFGNQCYTQYLHTHKQTQQTRLLTAYPPLTSTQTVSALLLSGKLSVFVLSVVLSCSLSSRDFLVEWKPDSLSVNPLIASRYYTLAAGGSWKAQSQMEGGGFAHRGRHASWGVGVGVGVIHPSIHPLSAACCPS